MQSPTRVIVPSVPQISQPSGDERTYVLSYNQGPWNIQAAIISAKSPEIVAQAIGAKVYFQSDNLNQARIKLPKDTFTKLSLPELTIRHILEADENAPPEFQDEIRLRLTALPVIRLASAVS